MNPSELFDLWAPATDVWSRWAKPVLFAELGGVQAMDPNADPLPQLNVRADLATAYVLDLPGPMSVKAGLALLQCGIRPVPLFNGNRGPGSGIGPLSIVPAEVNNDSVVAWLLAGATLLQRYHLAPGVPPAFLLDSRRNPTLKPGPGRFDNRWIVFPQDFPSAAFLKAHGNGRVVLVQEDPLRQPAEDLAHVLRRWQEAGLSLFISSLEGIGAPQPLAVPRPKRFRSLWYAALAVAGFRRSSAGGFGSIVPQPSSG